MQILCMEDVISTKTEWLWEPYIPSGKITCQSNGTNQEQPCSYL